MGGEWLEHNFFFLIMVSGMAKILNGDAPERNNFVICENDMLRSGYLGLKMGFSRAAHT